MKYDMQVDILKDSVFGKIALNKMGSVPEGFRLYEAGWLEDDLIVLPVIKVSGAEFRLAKTGINKGKMTVMVPGTKVSVYVTAEELRAEESY
jgi:hypothetical protein